MLLLSYSKIRDLFSEVEFNGSFTALEDLLSSRAYAKNSRALRNVASSYVRHLQCPENQVKYFGKQTRRLPACFSEVIVPPSQQIKKILMLLNNRQENVEFARPEKLLQNVEDVNTDEDEESDNEQEQDVNDSSSSESEKSQLSRLKNFFLLTKTERLVDGKQGSGSKLTFNDELTTFIAQLTTDGLTCTDIKKVIDALVERFPFLVQSSGRKITKKRNIVIKESFDEERRVPSLRCMDSMRDLIPGSFFIYSSFYIVSLMLINFVKNSK